MRMVEKTLSVCVFEYGRAAFCSQWHTKIHTFICGPVLYFLSKISYGIFETKST